MLDRPQKANALSLAMLRELDDIFASAAENRDLRLLVVTGAGDRVFCAGADLGEATGAGGITTSALWERVSGRLAGLACLTIAALNGTLAGGGFGLALACDLRIAVPGANFFYPVLGNGFLPQPSDVRRMISLIGPSRSKLILMAGQKLSAPEALGTGLVDRIASAQNMEGEIETLGSAALTGKEAVLAAIKRLCRDDCTARDIDDCFAAVYEGEETALARLRL